MVPSSCKDEECRVVLKVVWVDCSWGCKEGQMMLGKAEVSVAEVSLQRVGRAYMCWAREVRWVGADQYRLTEEVETKKNQTQQISELMEDVPVGRNLHQLEACPSYSPRLPFLTAHFRYHLHSSEENHSG